MPQSVRDLIARTRLGTPEEVETFHRLRKEAFRVTQSVYEDRSVSYNVDHEPVEEMPFGLVSLASELFKRAIRMCGILTPLRTDPLRPEDVARLADTCIDMMNYGSWAYALVKMATDKSHSQLRLPDAPLDTGAVGLGEYWHEGGYSDPTLNTQPGTPDIGRYDHSA